LKALLTRRTFWGSYGMGLVDGLILAATVVWWGLR
jgi:hypothetical protein